MILHNLEYGPILRIPKVNGKCFSRHKRQLRFSLYEQAVVNDLVNHEIDYYEGERKIVNEMKHWNLGRAKELFD